MQGIDETLLSQLEAGFKLPVKPAALEQLQAELNRNDPSIDVVSELIATDVAMSATVLRVVNSPNFGKEKEITDINYAVILLGLNTISHIVSRYLLKQVFRQQGCCISLARFWDTSTEISRLCVYIGQSLTRSLPADNLQTLGLFHDIGIPVMAMNYPDYVNVLNEANDNVHASLTQLEDKRYPCNHAILGFYMAHSWHLPKVLCNTVLRHHDLDFLDEHQSSEEERLYYAILKVAENIAHTHKRFRSINNWSSIESQVLVTLGWQQNEYQARLEAGESLLIFNAN
ncbi:HDOD domain protein [Pseudoalteromonas sp. THAF3]|uniref:HDOD domain-containing protein n=1 Tax=Pseudoalteromonas sp. THAF3 TaxID=2587843 RepID=UPI001267A48A|nr:HDOD domain-containing protein [Pseudoalteromonas sp. THAF3]QFU03740.1 HDOD domain protein [Pseudoalteromonas sp. THAF3]